METPAGQAPPTNPTLWPRWVRARLDALFDALTFPTPTRFRFADDPPVEVETTPEGPDPDRLVEALWPVLYERAYARTFHPTVPTSLPKPTQPDREFLARLSAGHASRTRWDPAWLVDQVGNDGSIRALKGEACRFAPPGQYAFGADSTRPPRPGEYVDLLAIRESFVAQPGYYFAHGGSPGCDFDSGRVSRIYFHATADGMPHLLDRLGTRLNRHEVPFLLKCRDDPAQYDRADAAVLYVAARYLTIVLRLLEEIDDTLAPHLRPGSPLFTKELRPGLGFADNPGTFESFGHSRCLLVARALVTAHLAGHQDRETRHRTLADHFARAGLDPARPHLGPGLTDPYYWPEGGPWTSEAAPFKPTRPSPESSPFLEAANRIGRRLCRDAIWAGGRCNWMTWTTEDIAGRPTLVRRAALPSLFDGVAGIALFLAHLQRFTGDRQQQIALGGAIRQILATAPGLQAQGYERGRLGVGHALVKIGELLGDEILIERGIGLMRAEPAPAESLDVPGDCAGAIAPLIDIALRFDRPELLELARGHGEALLDHSLGSSEEIARPKATFPDAARIARALLELDQAAPDQRLRLTATRILDGVLDDARSLRANETDLALLRIRELLDDHRPISIELDDSIEAALASLEQAEWGDLSLSQGLTGRAEFLLQVAESLARPELKLAAESVGRSALERFDRPPIPWPCGVPGVGETPDLWLGVAGIGLFLLRLHDPKTIPSPLLVSSPMG